MLYSLCKVERIVLTKLNEAYYYYYYYYYYYWSKAVCASVRVRVCVLTSVAYIIIAAHKDF